MTSADNISDILEISDLIDDADGNFSGGFLKFDTVSGNPDGTMTLKLSMGSAADAGGEDLSLAVVVVSATEVQGIDVGSFTRLFIEQLIPKNDIIF